MRNDIKTKVKNKTIKEKRQKEHLSKYIKESNIATKSDDNDKEESTQNTNANAQRDDVQDIEQTSKSTVYRSYYKAKSMIRNHTSNSTKSTSYKSIEPIEIQSFSQNKSVSNKQYAANMKSLFAHKQRLNAKDNVLSKKLTDKLSSFVISSIEFIKKAVSSFSTLISIGTGGLLLIVISLFIGVFASLSDNSIYGATLPPLSDEVLAYTDLITEYAIEHDIEEYVALILAIMMVESKGLGDDQMDAGRYINQTIDNPEYSIEIGIKYLANCLNKSSVTSPADTEEIYLAIQGYDFKDEYIISAIDNFGGYSKSNTQIYFDQFLSEGDVNYVDHVMQNIDFSFRYF